ncbi:DNA/RNA non-specific endonuclease [Bacillus haynesii]|uniref:DNA/RNA non-specific endonuclease n=1 Tax=Bacillus haynesii TaxID=1925021 RepID=UPI002E11DAD7
MKAAASIFEGSGKLDNLVPMDGNLNKGELKKIENMWAKHLDTGRTVEVRSFPPDCSPYENAPNMIYGD